MLHRRLFYVPGLGQFTEPGPLTAGYTYRHHDMIIADSKDNLILPAIQPVAIADDITSTRSLHLQRHIPQRNSWPTTTKSIQSA